MWLASESQLSGAPRLISKARVGYCVWFYLQCWCLQLNCALF